MLRVRTSIQSLGLAAFLVAPIAHAQSPESVVSFAGTISHRQQADRFTFEVRAGAFQLNSRGAVDFVFVVRADSSALMPVDPAPLVVETAGSQIVAPVVSSRDVAASLASVSIASLKPGTYTVIARSERDTTGAYVVDGYLAGDADRDLEVGAADVRLIASLDGVRKGEEAYVASADVDRNGLIDAPDRRRAQANAGAKVVEGRAASELDTSLPPGALALAGRSPDAPGSPTGGLKFALAGSEFDNTPAETVVVVNGVRVPAERLTISPHLLTADVVLNDGPNEISLKAYDVVGRPLFHQATLWAGSCRLRVDLIDAEGRAFTRPASVVAALGDNRNVGAEGLTAAGTITFSNLPRGAVAVGARAIDGGESGTAAALGSDGVVTIRMR